MNEPAVGGISPARIRRRVVFPEPDGPNTQTNSRGETSKETSSSARSPPLLSGNTALKLWMVRIGVGDIIIYRSLRGVPLIEPPLATLAPGASAGVTSWNKLVCKGFIQIHLFCDQPHIEQNILHVFPGLGIRITKPLCFPLFDGCFKYLLLHIGIQIGKIGNIRLTRLEGFLRIRDRICQTLEKSADEGTYEFRIFLDHFFACQNPI